ncbi:MAG: drug/metabolite transporter, family [Gaiellaceae bacterium]|jgi:drug/metabolite transporter (DMT)-like permease|nr:drug/metabolite transporter, family [Gaiellaceae bacterium]
MQRRIPGVLLIALAAAMWGTDPILRKPLGGSTSATTIVFGEHVLLVLLTLPFLLPALRAMLKAGPRYILAAVAVGAGASALATILFTEALFHGDFITPVVIQKVQPLVAVMGAAIVLGERPRPRFAWFLLPALLGFWLVNQEHPLDPTAKGLIPIMQALAAAVLWALGTVLGRFLGRELAFQQILTLRFFFGLVASAIALPVMGAKAYAGAHDSLWIAYLAIVTGLIALALYYFGLKRTPAVLASLAELTYPAIAVVAGIYAYNSHLRWTQWLGIALIIGIVSLLPVQRRRTMVVVPAAVPSPA